jgi:4-aminobutyrate aminotransferase
VFEKDKILDNVNARSEQMFARLRALQEDELVGRLIQDVRGKGLMIA